VTFTLPLTAGAYTVRLHPNNDYAVLASATVTIGGITFTPSATTVSPGGTVTMTVGNGPGNAGDWIGLFAADGSRVAWKYLNGGQTAPAVGLASATVPFALPSTGGTYTLRLYASYSQTLLATSAPVTVATPVGTTVTLNTTTVVPGGTVLATIANGPGNAADWIALYAAGGTTYLDWQYLNGTRNVPATGATNATVAFTLPTTPGTYTLQFYLNNSYTLLATSVAITVRSVTLTVDTPTAAPGATVQATIADGPGNATDWVALFAPDGITRLD
jgi:hypothetical protein